MRQKICWILAIIFMAVIFGFSAKDAEESTKDSNAVGMWIGEVVHSDFDTWQENEQQEFADRWDHPVRKCAHMTEYAILGFFLFGAYCKDGAKYRNYMLMAFGTAVFYAMTDEFHQYFVPGRACMITDVGFDSVGAAVGVAFSSFLFIKLLGKYYNREY